MEDPDGEAVDIEIRNGREGNGNDGDEPRYLGVSDFSTSSLREDNSL